MCECEKDRERGDERTRERVGEREKERDYFFLNNAFNTVPTDVNLACSFDTDSGENSQVVFWLVMTVLFFSRWFSLFFLKKTDLLFAVQGYIFKELIEFIETLI